MLTSNGSPGRRLGHRTVNTGPLPEECIKFEGRDVGREGVSGSIFSITVTLSDWVTKDGEHGDYVGFSFDSQGRTLWLSVKAGNEIFDGYDSSGSWLHPEGTSGPGAHGISSVVFCDDAPDLPPTTPPPGQTRNPDDPTGGSEEPTPEPPPVDERGDVGAPCMTDADCRDDMRCGENSLCQPNL